MLLHDYFGAHLIAQLTLKFPKSKKRGPESWGVARVSILFLVSAV